MALVVETGSGVAGADSYAATVAIDAYWTARPHDPRAAAWSALGGPAKDGAAREASAWLDAQFADEYRGRRVGYVQGLEWPRTDGLDDAGAPTPVLDANGIALPALPPHLVRAVAVLAAMAGAGELAEEASRAGVKRVRVGDVETEFVTATPASGALATVSPTRQVVEGLIAPLLDSGASWLWR